MSLDVYLNSKQQSVECTCSECGHVHTIEQSEVLFSRNITHNLGEMAEKADLYVYLWRPEDACISVASDLIPYLEKGLNELECFPETYSAFNAKNGWGKYENLVEFVRSYLQACKEHPDALIEVSR